MRREYLIRRYQQNHFRGWVVSTKRQGKRFARYFSDRTGGCAAALKAAQVFRDQLVAQLPPPTKVKRRDIRDTTGVIGVARVREYSRSGKLLVRYVASWPKRNGKRGKATFSIGLYGENDPCRLAVALSARGMRELGDIVNLPSFSS